jgi:hypothetical protein
MNLPNQTSNPRANVFFTKSVWPPPNHFGSPIASRRTVDDGSPLNDFDDGLDMPPINNFNDGLEMQGFIYKEPSESYWEDKNRLDNLGPFHNERWQKMVCIHFILPNMTARGQAATPRTARVPHYHSTLLEVQSKVDSFRSTGGVVRFTIYQPDQDYSNSFLHIVNTGVEGIASVNWDALAQVTYKKGTGDKKRQRKFKDFGTTSGKCTTRLGSSEGVAKPSYKPGTQDPLVVESMLALCSYVEGAVYKWMPDGLRPFNCDSSNHPRNKFAKRFHKDCFIPAARVALTNIEHPCRYHSDELNSLMYQYQMVPTFSKVVILDGSRWRCAVIGYSRRLVDEYLV